MEKPNNDLKSLIFKKDKQNSKTDLKMPALSPAGFAVKSRTYPSKSQEFRMLETVIFLLLEQQLCLVESTDQGVL